MNNPKETRYDRLICLGLALVVLSAYLPVLRCGFISYDDPTYVTVNPNVQHGLNWASVKWAFTTGHAANWHPLTWISHIVDYQLFGLNPVGHHFTNLALHIANTVLLFLLLQRMTGAQWPSAMVAALFGLHPLHVESVAWIAERKDVLSTFFWILSIGAYVRYVESAQAKRTGALPYALSLLFFACGLMSKPMVVTLPFLLLLLDFWPLRRWGVGPVIWLEKVPFLTLAAGASFITYAVQQSSGAVSLTLPLGNRLANAVVSYARYMGKTFWPGGLSVLYPHPASWPIYDTILASALLAVVTGLVVWRWRVQPFLAIGWFWFLGTLVPAIGLVQVGEQAMADRYTYIPIVGLFIMVVWGVSDWLRERPVRLLGAGLSAVVCLACAAATTAQVRFWRNSLTLYSHAIAVDPGNYVIYCNLGKDALDAGNNSQAIKDYQQALLIAPHFDLALDGLGKALLASGRLAEAAVPLTSGVELHPENPSMHYDLGYVYLGEGRVADALGQFEQHVALIPNDFAAQHNFAEVLMQNGLLDDALIHYQLALKIHPDEAESHYELGMIFWQKGRAAEAEAEFERTLQINATDVKACSHLAWCLATSPRAEDRDGVRAVALAMKAAKLSGGDNPSTLGVLAAAQAECGQYAAAVEAAQKARQMALAQTNSALANVLAQQLLSYEAGAPYRDSTDSRTRSSK